MMRRHQQGFSLVAAIFLVTVLAALGAFLVVTSGVAQQTPTLGQRGTQAYHAARSGLEWGIAGAVNTDNTANCNGTLALGGFNVAVSCTMSTHTDGTPPSNVNIYVIEATATPTGTSPGSIAFASRTLRAIASPDGPL